MNESPAIATLVFLGITTYVSARAFKSRELINKLLFSPFDILRSKEYHRLITSGFIHADWAHLFFNMFSLYSFGSAIELSFGPSILILIYGSSIVGGNLFSLYLHRHQDYKALGASGGVCGVIFATIFLLPGGSVTIFPLPIGIPSWLYAILFILVSFFGMRSQTDHIGHDAHLGGALVGLAVATAIQPAIIVHSPILYLTVVAVSVLLLVYSCRHPLLRTPILFTKKYWRTARANITLGHGRKKKQCDKEMADRLLHRISSEGIDSLTAPERKQLMAILNRTKS